MNPIYLGVIIGGILLLVNLLLVKIFPQNNFARFIPGIFGFLSGVILVLISLNLIYGWDAVGYLILAITIIVISTISLGITFFTFKKQTH